MTSPFSFQVGPSGRATSAEDLQPPFLRWVRSTQDSDVTPSSDDATGAPLRLLPADFAGAEVIGEVVPNKYLVKLRDGRRCQVNKLDVQPDLERYADLATSGVEVSRREVRDHASPLVQRTEGGPTLATIRPSADTPLETAPLPPAPKRRDPKRKVTLDDVCEALGAILSDPDLDKPPVWLVYGIAALAHLTLVAAASKCGKSTKMSSAAAEVSNRPGGETVLWVTFEESRAQVARRLALFGAHPTRTLVLSGLSLTGKDADSFLYAAITKHAPTLVIVDSLSSYTQRAELIAKENDTDGWANVLLGLKALADETKSAIVLLHHTNRVGGVRGAGGITSNPDQIVVMTRGENNTVVRFTSHGRINPSGEDSKFAYSYSPQTHKYQRIGADAVGPETTMSFRERVLRTILEVRCGTDELRAKVGCNEQQLRTLLRKEEKAGTVVQGKDGRKRPWMVSPTAELGFSIATKNTDDLESED